MGIPYHFHSCRCTLDAVNLAESTVYWNAGVSRGAGVDSRERHHFRSRSIAWVAHAISRITRGGPIIMM